MYLSGLSVTMGSRAQTGRLEVGRGFACAQKGASTCSWRTPRLLECGALPGVRAP